MKVNLNKPNTHRGEKPADVVGRLVRVRPYYHVPSSRSSLTPARSPFAFEAHVLDTFGSDMVLVRFTWGSGDAPWKHEGAYYPDELHKVWRECQCPACSYGDGIPHLRGA